MSDPSFERSHWEEYYDYKKKFKKKNKNKKYI